jgi:Tfp pilus assembly protein PilO
MARLQAGGFQKMMLGARGAGQSPRVIARVVLGALVAANIAAAVIVLKPWSGSAEALEQRASVLRRELQQKRAGLERLRGIVSKVETARGDGDRFMGSYLLSRRSVSSNLLDDLDQTARKAGIKQKEVTFNFEKIEGSESLSKATITAAYEGNYSDLMHFLNLLDRSPRLLIIESLAASPQPTGPALSITMKLNAFVREGLPGPAVEAVNTASVQGAQE